MRDWLNRVVGQIPLVQSDEPLLKGKLGSILIEVDQVDRTRLPTATEGELCIWLRVKPCLSLGTQLISESLFVAIGLILGTSLYEPQRCKYDCHVNQSGLRHSTC